MTIKQIRLSNQAKEQLIRLKTRTGIQNWNVLCRWALCVSLREPTPPSPIDVPADSNVEMSWHVFGGEHHEIYLALVKERCEGDGLGTTDEVVARQFRLHLHRGISYLATPGAVRSVAELVKLVSGGVGLGDWGAGDWGRRFLLSEGAAPGAAFLTGESPESSAASVSSEEAAPGAAFLTAEREEYSTGRKPTKPVVW